jgi:5-methylcytosine-specific restriction protein A
MPEDRSSRKLMPNAAPKACHCGQLDCTNHRAPVLIKESRRATDIYRKDDPHRAIYRTKQWQRTRKHILTRDPLCKIGVLCVQKYGTLMPSTDVDHVIPIRAGGDPWDENNLQGACHADHARKTVLERNDSTSKGT